MNRYIKPGILFVLILLLYWSCSKNIAGGSSDHGNAITVSGIICDTFDTGISNVFLRLLPEDYNPVASDFDIDSMTAFTDSLGYFNINNVNPGVYCLTGVDSTRTLRLLKKPIYVDSSDIDNLKAVLSRPGFIRAPIDAGMWLVNSKITIYIPGTNSYKTLYQGIKSVSLDSIPCGIYSLMAYLHNSDTSVLLNKEFTKFSVMSEVITDFTLFPFQARGPSTVSKNTENKYYTFFKYWDTQPDIEVQFLEYRFSWGDSDTSQWSNTLSASHAWTGTGTYEIKVQMRYYLNTNISIQSQNSGIRPFYTGWSESFIVNIDKNKNKYPFNLYH